LPVEFRGLGHVFLAVRRACDWYGEIGISIEGSRLERIRTYIETRLLRTDTPEAHELEKLTPRAETYYALSDGAAFGLIAKQLSSLSSNLLPRRTLRDILSGPLVPKEETPASSDGRNKFVELELAAYLSSAGFELKAFDDVAFEFEGVRYYVECKRPFRAGRLEENIDKAYRQLRTKLVGPNDRGIIAVALDKMLGLDRVVQEFPTHSSASEFAEGIAKRLLARVERYQSEWVDPRVVGFYGVIQFISRTESPPSFGPSYNLALLIIATPHSGQEVDFQRLGRMMKRVKTSFGGSVYGDAEPRASSGHLGSRPDAR
jgi:hypothetical protein